MKTTILILTLATFMFAGVNFNPVVANGLSSPFLPAEKKTETVKVYGNCGMCETRIEKAAKGVDGVKEAEWDKEKKELTITFDPDVTNLETIEKEIAAVGHDTESVKAKDEIYEALHSCCKYDRPEEKYGW